MFDALSFPQPSPTEPASPLHRLSMPITVGPLDRTRFLMHGRIRHLNRIVRCGWHLAVHHGARDTVWTHLYKVVPDHGGRVQVLLHGAMEGDHGDAPERFSFGGLPVGAEGCKAG